MLGEEVKAVISEINIETINLSNNLFMPEDDKSSKCAEEVIHSN